MEYIILKLYQNEKQKSPDVEQRFSKFETKVKIFVIGCFTAILLSSLEMIATLLLYPNQWWYVIGAIISLVALFILLWIDNKDQKEHMDIYADSHKKKLEILEKILSTEFCINNKEKYEELIDLYKQRVEKKNEDEKKRNKIIIKAFSALSGILTILFENRGVIGIDVSDWIYWATILSILVVAASTWIYSFTLLDAEKRKYEMMIRELKEIMLIKY